MSIAILEKDNYVTDDLLVRENVPRLDELSCTQGLIVDGDKFYGYKDSTDSFKVELLDPNTSEIHCWYRKGHTLFKIDNEKRQYVISEQMVPCPYEHKYLRCTERYDSEHRKHHYHFSCTPSRIISVKGIAKSVCRYSEKDNNNMCWERFNPEHMKKFHHDH
jgi:hypothetical protein